MFKGLAQRMNLGIIAMLVGFGGLSLARADSVCESYAFYSAEKDLAETFVVSELVYWLPQYLQSTVIDCRYFSQDDILEYSTIISWLGFDALDYFEVGVSFTVTPQAFTTTLITGTRPLSSTW